MRRKITSENGETLAELMVSVLVISLALTMFATALMSARRMLELGETKLQTYYTERNILDSENSKNAVDAVLVLELDGDETDLACPAARYGAGQYSVRLFSGDTTSFKNWRYSRTERTD